VSTGTLVRLAMATAGIMLAHQVASKAFRDATFLSVWPTTALPLMVAAAAVAGVAAVPLFARLLERFGSRVVVPAGFVASACGHVLEWQLLSGRPWVAVLIYLHIAGLGALLLSGFWSMISERFDPRGARSNFGRIAAAGTVGGALGGLAAERFAVMLPTDAVLLLLAALHLSSAAGVWLLGRAPVLLQEPVTESSDRVFAVNAVRASPHLRTIATIVLLTTAAATVLDFLLKWRVTDALGTGPYLLRFFAIFYGVVQVGSFFAQAGASAAVRRVGIGRTIASLPAGVGVAGAVALIFPVWQVVVLLRGVEAVLRYSFFRSGYEMLFVPMDAKERSRVKTFLDVTCDRAGEAFGAVLVQALVFASMPFANGGLIATLVALSAMSVLLARRLDRLYLGAVEQQLAKHASATPLIVGSETGWTIIDLPPPPPPPTTARAPKQVIVGAVRRDDPRVQVLTELRSGDRRRVEDAIARLSDPDRIHVAQLVQLLAWDDLVGSARRALEHVAASHIGLLVDVLLDPSTDFAIRRRVPRILGTIASDRVIDGLVRGLDDARFEVRYQCARALARLAARHETFAVDRARILAIVERELSVPLQVWQGHRLIDQIERDDEGAVGDGLTQRNFEHVFLLLTTVLPREPLQVALRGIGSPNAGLRGLALEYLESVLPPTILARLWQLVDVPPAERPAHRSPERALEELRISTETPMLKNPDRGNS
jgi:MFS family permease